MCTKDGSYCEKENVRGGGGGVGGGGVRVDVKGEVKLLLKFKKKNIFFFLGGGGGIRLGESGWM